MYQKMNKKRKENEKTDVITWTDDDGKEHIQIITMEESIRLREEAGQSKDIFGRPKTIIKVSWEKEAKKAKKAERKKIKKVK